MAEKIGIVGVGRMGANMARRLKDSGYEIAAVYDVDSVRAQTLAQELGAQAGDAIWPMSPKRPTSSSRS